MSDANENKAVKIVKSLVGLVGVTAGIIISAIGAIMFLESIFKVYVFDVQNGRYNNYEYRCEQYDVDSIEARRLVGDNIHMLETKAPVKNKDAIKELTEKQRTFLKNKYKECKIESKEDSYKDFINGEKMDIATGIAFILVGLPLLYFYQRRRKDKK